MAGQPTGRDLHIDVLLTNLSIAYKNPGYIADDIFPQCPVNKQSNRVPKYDQSHWFRSAAKKRAPGTESRRIGLTVDTTDTYFCDRWSLGFEIADEDRDNQDAPFDLDRDAMEFLTDKMFMARDVNFVNNFFTTGKWATDKVGATDFTKFSDYAGSDPLGVVTAYRDAVESLVAVEPNTFVLGKLVYSILKWHPDLIDLIKYTQKGQLTPDLVASLLEFDKLLIGRAIQTTATEGTAEGSVTYSRIWGKHGLMLFVPQRPSLMTPSAGYCFVWQRVAAALQYIKRMREEKREVDIIEINSYFAQKITANKSGLFMQNVVA